MDGRFVHEKCGHDLIFDFSRIFTVRSPGIMLSFSGPKISVAELSAKQGKVFMFLYCSKCKQELEVDDPTILSRCLLCRENKPHSKIMYCDEIPGICKDCLKYAQGGKNIPDNIKDTLPYIRISPDSNTISILDILKQKLVY